MINNANFSHFKSYDEFRAQNKKQNPPKNDYKRYALPLLGSSLGVAAGYMATKNRKFKNPVLKELVPMLAMLGGANTGSVILGSIGKKTETVKKKVHEGAFQIMNAAIPLLMVSGVNEICNRTKSNKATRILASFAAMASGAVAATKITNATKKDDEPKRKYTIKDSIANVDDLAATFCFGFGEQAQKLNITGRLMPFIYAYCGTRAGAKE